MRVKQPLGYFAKYLAIKLEVEQLLNFSAKLRPGSVMELTHAVMRLLQKAPRARKFAACQTREDLFELLQEDIFDNRTILYYLVTLAETRRSDVDTDLALNVGALAEDHVAGINDDREALARVYWWLNSSDITREDRALIMMTYSRTKPYLKYKKAFDSITDDLSISTITDFVRELDDAFVHFASKLNSSD